MSQYVRIGYNVLPEHVEALKDLASLRYGDNASAALRDAIQVGALVLGDRATFGLREAEDVVAAYVQAHCADE